MINKRLELYDFAYLHSNKFDLYENIVSHLKKFLKVL